MAAGLGLALALPTAGLIGFVWTVAHSTRIPTAKADAVVLFTGEPRRIETALQALAGGGGRRLLITGTELSAGTDTAAMMAQVRREHPDLFACCVDLDPRARNTRENARDAAGWVRGHGFTSLVLVTADYHLPRARLELACAAPGIRISPHPMQSEAASPARLWREPAARWGLPGEAAKFALAWLRIKIDGCPPAPSRDATAHGWPPIRSAMRDPADADH